MHHVVDGHDTDVSTLPVPDDGVDALVHAVPSHSLISGIPEAVPTAAHRVVDGHATPRSSPPVDGSVL